MQLSQMRYFIEVARTGNISAAAKNLFLSQPSLSQSIHNLETELGIPLLIRHSKSVSLTDAGEQFLIHAERIVGSTDQLSELMQKHSRILSGNLRLGIPWIAGYLGLFTLLRRYQQAMPGIRYELTIRGSDLLLKQLLSRNLHGIFMISTEAALEAQKDLYFRKINEENYVAWVPEDHPLAQKKELTISDLHQQTLVMPSPESVFSRQLSVLFHNQGVTPHILCETSLTDTIRQITEEGLAIGFASDSIARKACPKQCRILPLEEKIHRTIYYVTLKELIDYPTIESFTNYVRHYVFEPGTDNLSKEENQSKEVKP